MEKFTKGEWFVYPSSSFVAVESEYGSLIYNRDVYQSTILEQTANAHLIAAAPDMYTMLKSIIDPDVNVDSVICGIADLLEKARGE